MQSHVVVSKLNKRKTNLYNFRINGLYTALNFAITNYMLPQNNCDDSKLEWLAKYPDETRQFGIGAARRAHDDNFAAHDKQFH